MDSATERDRPLHAKIFEILCRRGRLIVSGSANGTRAGLDQGGNVEASVLRIQREPLVGWRLALAERPEPQGSFDAADDKVANRAGVLRAVLEGDEVVGEVLTPNMNGSVRVFHLAAIGPKLLGETLLDDEGRFRFAAPGLERWSRRGGRLVIRVTHGDGRSAEGFVSVASFAEIARRGGIVTRRLFAVIFGNETPEDVNAIMSWLLEDPRRLLMGTGATQGGGETAAGGAMVKKSELQDFVDRIEVLYVLSQMLRDKDVDLPGRQYLAPLTEGGGFHVQRRQVEEASRRARVFDRIVGAGELRAWTQDARVGRASPGFPWHHDAGRVRDSRVGFPREGTRAGARARGLQRLGQRRRCDSRRTGSLGRAVVAREGS